MPPAPMSCPTPRSTAMPCTPTTRPAARSAALASPSRPLPWRATWTSWPQELGMDPVELRRKNAMRVGAMTATGQTSARKRGAAGVSGPGGGGDPTLEARDCKPGRPGDCHLGSPYPDRAANAMPGALPPATRTPGWAAARRTRPRPRSRSSPTAAPRSAPAARRWGRT